MCNHPICPMCDNDSLELVSYSSRFHCEGIDFIVNDLEGYYCSSCGADPIFEEQIQRNHAKILKFKVDIFSKLL